MLIGRNFPYMNLKNFFFFYQKSNIILATTAGQSFMWKMKTQKLIMNNH